MIKIIKEGTRKIENCPNCGLLLVTKKCLEMPDLCDQLLILLVQNLTKFAKFEIKNDGLQVKICVKMALTCQKNGKVAKFEIKNGK